AHPRNVSVARRLFPSPGTPGEGRVRGISLPNAQTLTPTLSRNTGRGRRTSSANMATKHLRRIIAVILPAAMDERFDVIVIGVGGFGSAACYLLSRLGVRGLVRE